MQESINEVFGKLVKKHREREKMSQIELALKIKCSLSYISLIENNHTNVTLELAEQISIVLKIDLHAAIVNLLKDAEKKK